jgi:PTH2 family peptidyl-tRNA hydrolase
MSDHRAAPKQVIVVRRDLNMRKGKMCAQAAHAAMKVMLDRKLPAGENRIQLLLTEPMMQWLEGSFTKIVVGCDSEQELLDLEARALEQGVPHALIVDNGWTEFHGVPTPTCLAVGPDLPDLVDAITGGLRLL